jgi:hypothetical protein
VAPGQFYRRDSQQLLLAVKPFPQVLNANRVAVPKPRGGKLSGVESLANLLRIRSDESRRLFDAHGDGFMKFVQGHSEIPAVDSLIVSCPTRIPQLWRQP